MRANRFLVASFAVLVALAIWSVPNVGAQAEATFEVSPEATATIVETATATATLTPFIESTFDPCLENVFEEQGEVIDLCVTPSATPTIDPCAPLEENPDPCATPSSTVTSTSPAATPIPSLTPTLEYEIDEPVSFFPDETAEPGNEETVAAAETEAARGTSTPETLEEVTGLPNTGAGSSGNSTGTILLAILLIGLLGSALAARYRSNAR